MMFEMLTGSPPFYRGNIEYQHVNVKPEGLENTTASPELKEFIEKSIEKEPADRFQSADEMIEAFKSLNDSNNNNN